MEKETALKICFVGSARYSNPLGATNEKKFCGLKKLGELFVIGFSRDYFPRRFTQYAHFYLLPQLPSSILRYIEMFTVVPLLVCWLIFRERIQVLVAQSPYEGVSAAFAKKLAGWFGCKVVLVVESHGDFEESLFLYRRILFPRLYRFLMHHAVCFTFQQTDVLRAISDATRQQLEQRKLGKPIFQFATWTNIDVFVELGGALKSHFSATFLYAGVVSPLKGLIYLVNAFASIASDFSQAKLILVGREENPAYASELKAQVKELGLNNRIQFVSELPQTELAQLMRDASVFILPSLSEALGRVVIEAMATGTPVIGCRVGGIPEIIQDKETGFLVPPKNELVLAEKMRWVLEHPREVHEMGGKAHIFARSFFSTENYVRGYQQIFETAQQLLYQNSDVMSERQNEANTHG